MAGKGIIYLADDVPGITRRRRGKGWNYLLPDGKPVRDAAEISRLNGIALPPAYRNCWFSPLPNSHLQATGYDARKRKQYRYHVDFRTTREGLKFDRLPGFGEALPDMRKRVAADLRQRTPSKDRALAAIVRLLDAGLVRIGNDCYTRDNESYGATTLEMSHAEATSRRLHLNFRAKSGKQRELSVDDAGLLRFVRDMKDLPGQRLFRYLDEAGGVHEVHSHDVNDYIRAEIGGDYSAKDFRTFGASALAFGLLATASEKLSVKALTEAVSAELGNTPAVTRKSYIHPALIELCGADPETLAGSLHLPRRTEWMAREERGLIAHFS